MKKEHKPKPLVLAVYDAECDIINSVNKALRANVPCYVLEMILDKIHCQIKSGISQELSAANEQYSQDATDGGKSSEKESQAK